MSLSTQYSLSELAKLKIYFIGIGGSGMSGIARIMLAKGFTVSGSDKNDSPLLTSLKALGARIEVGHKEENLGDAELVIISAAIREDNPELALARKKLIPVAARAQALAWLMSDSTSIAVAGTHGKTTTSSLVAHLLREGGIDCSAFLGGIASNYASNLLIGKHDVVVVEADEYDRSFLTLHPDIAVITSMDADHLDIYGEEEQLHQSFQLFANQLKSEGELIVKEGLPIKNSMSYGLSKTAEAKGYNLNIKNGAFRFDFENDNIKLTDLILGLPGQHNIENAVAAIQIALTLNIKPELIRSGLASFKGVKRRFEYQVRTNKHIYIDDYAHHPEELKACFKAVRSLYPDKKLSVIFQPHLFSRTRDFAQEFSNVLNTADEIFLLDIYPARELPIEGVDSKMLANQMDVHKVTLCGKEECLEIIKNQKPELLLTVGAGDIDTLVSPIKNILS